MKLDLAKLGNDVVRQSVVRQMQNWRATAVPTAWISALLAAIYALVAVIVEERPAALVAAQVYTAGAWFLASWALALLVFMARGIVLGLADNPIAGERQAHTVTLAGLAIAAILLFGLAGTAKAAEPSVKPPATAQAAQSGSAEAYCGRSLGTWFYCARPDPEPEATTPQGASAPAASDQDRAIAEFERFKVELDKAQKLAVWVPTAENIERFYKLQRAALNQSSLFSDEYRRLIWSRPDLDYTLKRPVSELGKRQWSDQRSNDRELFLRKVSGEIGIFYVYRAACGACKVFSPVMRDFANRYTLTVKGVSTDGSDNPYLGDKMVDRGQLRAWGFDNPTTPSVLLYQNSNVDPRTGQVHPVYVRLSDDRTVKVNPCLKPQGCLSYIGAGIMAQDDIVERIYVLLATEPGQDY